MGKIIFMPYILGRIPDLLLTPDTPAEECGRVMCLNTQPWNRALHYMHYRRHRYLGLGSTLGTLRTSNADIACLLESVFPESSIGTARLQEAPTATLDVEEQALSSTTTQDLQESLLSRWRGRGGKPKSTLSTQEEHA